ncbi:MAG TPA: PIN domain-containing protein [Bryobacteraceae bacterium]|jgi:predicted nucleic acid-binding protein|nr:PIN domain-containing protein [Bryobacteraceae bacterium]
MALIFWDTNLFIYLLEQHPVHGEHVLQMRRRMLERGDSLVTSTITVGEVLVKPARLRNNALERQYLSLFSRPEVRLLSFDLDAAGHYARVRQDKAIRSPDAIQLACAASAKVDLFITNDDRLSRKNIPGIDFITSLARAPI